MSRYDHCPVCNISVAPFDPHRLERVLAVSGSRVVAKAHDYCIRRDGYQGAVGATSAFLAEHGASAEADEFAAKVRRVSGAAQLATLIERVLASVLRDAVNGKASKRQAILTFAAQMSERLYVAIDPSTVTFVVRQSAPRLQQTV